MSPSTFPGNQPHTPNDHLGVASSLRAIVGLVIGWTMTPFFWLPLVLVAVVTWRHMPDWLTTGVSRAWGRTVLWLFGIHLLLENASTLEERIPRVIVINHQSGLELAWFASVTPPGQLGLGKREIHYIPFINVIWWALRFLTVDRSRPAHNRRQLKSIARLIRDEKRSLLIAPEGTRTRDGSIQPFKHGAFRFAMDSSAAIYPVLVCGAFELLPKTRWLPRPGTLRVRFLPPIATSDWRHDDVQAHADEVRRIMQQEYAAMRQRAGLPALS